MRQIINFRLAALLSLIIFGFTLFFHAAIIGGIVFFDYAPVDFLWGGRMETRDELLVFEIISLVVVGLCILVVLIKSGRIVAPGLKRASGIILWLLFVLFLLNTIGNMLAKSSFEKFFSIVTMALAALCLRMAMEKEH